MDIVMTLAGPSMRVSHALGVCSGQRGVLRPSYGELGMADTPLTGKPFAGEWSGNQPAVARRTRPDAVSILDPHAASAPRRWSP